MNATILGSSEPADFYDAAPLEPLLLYQGEILVDVPFLNMPKDSRWLLLRTRSGRMVDEALQQGNLGGQVRVLDSNQSQEQWYGNATEGDFAMARLSKRPVLVLSQTCDVQTKDFIQIAPIFDADDLADVDTLKRGELLSAFYLQAHAPEFVESYADFELIQAVHKSYIKRILPEQHFRLVDAKVRELQRAITRYFGRPNSFDAGTDRVRPDKAPVAGTYLCVSCFYMDARVTAVERAEGQDFEHCPTCQGRGWVRQGRAPSALTPATKRSVIEWIKARFR